MKKIIAFILPLFIYLNISATSIGNLFFYRAQQFFGEPRFEKPLLGTFDFTISGGSTNHTRNDAGDTIDFLAVCGNNAYKGRFHLTEVTFSYIQNFTHGVFAGIFIPIEFIKITNICSIDCSLKEKTPQAPFKKHGISDITLYAGWTINYQDTVVLDYLDATLKMGAVIPTSTKKDPANPLSIPLGYNGHTGITLCADGSLGIYDWLTVGAHFETILFFSKQQSFSPTPDNNACFFPYSTANVHKGAVWQIGGYARADHVIRGLSALIGYSYTQQRKESISACLNNVNSQLIVPGDSLCKGWSMHTIHTAIEYDFTKEQMKIGPRIGIFYDVQAKGKNTFNTSMSGGIIGFDIDICY